MLIFGGPVFRHRPTSKTTREGEVREHESKAIFLKNKITQIGKLMMNLFSDRLQRVARATDGSVATLGRLAQKQIFSHGDVALCLFSFQFVVVVV